MITEQTKLRLRAFLQGPEGQEVLLHLRENAPPMPLEFQPNVADLQPHHVQLHHGFAKGNLATIQQLWSLAADGPRDKPEAERPKLVNTKNL